MIDISSLNALLDNAASACSRHMKAEINDVEFERILGTTAHNLNAYLPRRSIINSEGN